MSVRLPVKPITLSYVKRKDLRSLPKIPYNYKKKKLTKFDLKYPLFFSFFKMIHTFVGEGDTTEVLFIYNRVVESRLRIPLLFIQNYRN